MKITLPKLFKKEKVKEQEVGQGKKIRIMGTVCAEVISGSEDEERIVLCKILVEKIAANVNVFPHEIAGHIDTILLTSIELIQKITTIPQSLIRHTNFLERYLQIVDKLCSDYISLISDDICPPLAECEATFANLSQAFQKEVTCALENTTFQLRVELGALQMLAKIRQMS